MRMKTGVSGNEAKTVKSQPVHSAGLELIIC